EGAAVRGNKMGRGEDEVRDWGKGVQRWNKVIEKSGVSFRLKLPHVAFHRGIGEFANIQASPAGEILSAAEWAKQKTQWLPSKADGDFIAGLMAPCWGRGKFASWIAPPRCGIYNKPGDFEYVKDDHAIQAR